MYYYFYLQLIINSFSRRLVGKSFEYNVSELKLSELNIQPTGSIKAELTLICRIAEGIFSREDVHLEPESITALATLLLAMTRTYVTNRKVRVEESTVTSILRTYKALLWRMQDVRPHVAFFSRLFGPASHSRSLFNFQSVRAILGEVYYAYSEHESTCGVMTFAAAALRALISTDGKLLETRNFDLCMPVFQQLSSADEGVMSDEESEERVVISWSKILGPAGGHTPRSSTLCTAVIHECFRCLYDVENTVRSSALSSLRHLMDSIASWMESSDMEGETWADLMKAIIIPSIHNGLKRSVDVTKRCFVLLAGHILRSFRLIETSLSEDFKMCIHLEATFLLHEDPEQDFFENITHLQLHRRIRAMSKLRERLDKESDMSDRSDSVLSISTIMNVLLPVAYHPIESEEFLKKDHLTYLQEAAIFVGSLVKLLPWNQYFIVLKTILKMLDQQKKEKEKIILNSLCGVLDSFHFNMIGNEEPTDLDDPILERVRKLTSLEGSPDDDVIEADDAENLNEDQVDKSDNDIIEEEDNDDENEVDDEDANELATKGKANEGAVVAGKVTYASTSPEHISRVVINSVIPWVKVFLLKDDRDHKGNKSQTVRPQVAVALTKLICQLQPPVVSEEKKLGYFTNLVINVVGTLRSRDASARDAARDSLAKMILTTGMHSLYTVIYELRHLLTEGYQRHICNYSVKSILIAVLIDYQSPVHAQSIPLSSLYELSDNPNIGKLFDNIDFIKPELDRCVPMIMECVMDDLTGESRKDFTASETGVNRAVIRESKGSKANDILEISARYILFRPTYALAHQLHQLEFSSIHGLTSPLLNVLRDSEDPSLIGRVGEALQRVALGISRNPTLLAPELLLYLHSTLQPFTLKIIKDSLRKRQALGRIVKGELMTDTSINTIDELGADEIFGEDFPSYLRDDSDDEDEAALYSKKKVRHDNVTGFKANVWLPSQNQVLLDQKAVVEQREREKAERTKVLDGASAPLLTGYNRYKSERTGSSSGKYAGGSSDPAALAAVKFCLTTLQSCIKSERLSIDDEGVVTMLEPFLPILAHCLHLDDASNVATLALRCICSVLNWGVPFDPNLPRIIGNQMLKLMFKGGALLTTDGELVQACLKGLICLFQSFQHSGSNDEGNAQALAELELQTTSATKVKMTKTSKNKLQSDSNKTAPQHTLGMPLKEQNLRLLVQLLTSSINDVTSSYQNSAFQLVKVLVECKVMLPELYDLMEKLIDLIVLAHRKNVRESASSTVVSFMLYYPLGAKRFQVHLKKLLANCAYEYPEGREAALTALSNLVRLMPLTVLEEHAHMIYLPLALRTVNDSSERCRDAACEAILYLSRKVSPELFSQFYEYACKWMGTLSVVEPGVQSNGLVKTGARTATVLVSAKPDFLKKSGRVKRLVTLIRDDLITYMDSTAKVPLSQMAVPSSEKDEGDIGSTSWSVMYRLLLILDRLMTTLPSSTEEAMIQLMVPVPESPSRMHVLDLTQELMLHDHAWVQQAACSVIKSYLHRRDPSNLTTSPSELLAKPNNLYQLGRRLCVLVNRLELSRAHLDCVMECLGFVIRAMVLNPELTTDMSRDAGIDEDNINDEDNDYKESKIDEKFNRAADDSDSDEDSIESNDEEVIDNQDNEDDDDDDDMNDDNINETDNDDAEPIEQKDGANWVMQRLRGVGTDSRGHRRRHVILVSFQPALL